MPKTKPETESRAITSPSFNPEKMRQVTLSYYRDKQSVNEIAKNTGMSRPLVTRMLEEAVRTQMVRIEIVEPDRPFHLSQLEAQLHSLFGLSTATVTPNYSAVEGDGSQAVLSDLTSAAASSFLNLVRDNQVIAVSAGRMVSQTIQRMIPAQSERSKENLRVVPMVGYIGEYSLDSSAQSITTPASFNGRDLCRVIGGEYLELPCPALIRSNVLDQIGFHVSLDLKEQGLSEQRVQLAYEIVAKVITKDLEQIASERLFKEGFSPEEVSGVKDSIDKYLYLREIVCELPFIKDTLRVCENVNVLLTSLGHVDKNRLEALDDLGFLARKEDRDSLARSLSSKPAGEICGQLFDKDGMDIVSTSWRVIGIELSSIRQRVKEGELRVVMVVGADPKRYRPLVAALRGGLITDLTTDALTASKVIELEERWRSKSANRSSQPQGKI